MFDAKFQMMAELFLLFIIQNVIVKMVGQNPSNQDAVGKAQ